MGKDQGGVAMILASHHRNDRGGFDVPIAQLQLPAHAFPVLCSSRARESPRDVDLPPIIMSRVPRHFRLSTKFEPNSVSLWFDRPGIHCRPTNFTALFPKLALAGRERESQRGGRDRMAQVRGVRGRRGGTIRAGALPRRGPRRGTGTPLAHKKQPRTALPSRGPRR